jgi:P-type E1-E2 ATPase
VNASDYAICQFRFLSPLLLAHGRWNYRRMAYVVTYIFYKNILEAVSMFFFAFWYTAHTHHRTFSE